MVIVLLWFLVFYKREMLGDFSREEFITYILIGSMIGLLAGFFLRKIIARDIKKDESKLLVYKPFRYFYNVLLLGFGRSFMPFVLALSFHALLLYFLVDDFVPHFEKKYISLVAVMIMLAFIIELFIAYLLRFYVFWTIENDEIYKVATRLTKIMAGAYFPLSILPLSVFKTILVLPFAYSFFIPTQLYLKQISIEDGLRGILIQIFWIIVLYLMIKISWKNRYQKTINNAPQAEEVREFSNKYITTSIEKFDKNE